MNDDIYIFEDEICTAEEIISRLADHGTIYLQGVSVNGCLYIEVKL